MMVITHESGNLPFRADIDSIKLMIGSMLTHFNKHGGCFPMFNNHSIINEKTDNQNLSISTQQRMLSVFLAASLGFFMIWAVGFAQSQTIHDAAHDSRHSFTFPCH